jgi:uncharacterized protein
MKVKDLREKAAELAREFPAIVLVYLFGSQAGGVAGPDSDLDLAILVDHAGDTPEQLACLHYEFARKCPADRVDVLWLNQAPIELAFAVISQGIILFERDVVASRVEFEAGVMGRYGDYLPVLRTQRADLLRGGNHAARVQWHREALERTLRTLGEIRAPQGQKSE